MDMFIRHICEEESDYRVLSYAPGPVDTYMFKQIALKETKHESHMTALQGK